MKSNLSWVKAVAFGICVVFAAIVVAAVATPAESQGRSAGFMVASNGNQFAWRVNTVTGQVSYCVRRDNSLDEAYIGQRPPFCSAQSAPVQ